jgi:hypothetical protein
MEQYLLLFVLYNGIYDKFAGPISMNQLEVQDLHNESQCAVENYQIFTAFSYSGTPI